MMNSHVTCVLLQVRNVKISLKLVLKNIRRSVLPLLAANQCDGQSITWIITWIGIAFQV